MGGSRLRELDKIDKVESSILPFPEKNNLE